MIAEKGKKIRVHYTEPSPTAKCSTRPGEAPPGVHCGAGQMIPGFDSGVVGMKVGEERTLVLPRTRLRVEEGRHGLHRIPGRYAKNYEPSVGDSLQMMTREEAP